MDEYTILHCKSCGKYTATKNGKCKKCNDEKFTLDQLLKGFSNGSEVAR